MLETNHAEAEVRKDVTPEEALAVLSLADKKGKLTAEMTESYRGLVLNAVSNDRESSEGPMDIVKVMEDRLRHRPERYSRPEGVHFSAFKEALEANPELKASIAWMQETGGQPDIVAIEGNAFVIRDCSEESPIGRRNLTRAQAEKQALDHKVTMLDWATVENMRESGKFDLNSADWSRSMAEGELEEGRKTGKVPTEGFSHHHVNVDERDPSGHSPNWGWRGEVRLQMA